MSVTTSGLFAATFVDALGATQLALNLQSASNRCALFPNTITPDFTADPASYGAGEYIPGNEISGTGYTAGGTLMTGQTVTTAGGSFIYDASDTAWSGTTLTGVRCGLLYAGALAADNAFVLVTFGADYATVNGLFQINWSASGIFSVDITP